MSRQRRPLPPIGPQLVALGIAWKNTLGMPRRDYLGEMKAVTGQAVQEREASLRSLAEKRSKE